MSSHDKNPEGVIESSDKLPLAQFFEEQVLPYLEDEDKSFYQTLQDNYTDFDNLSKDFIREDYDKFSSYNPEVDEGENFYGVIVWISQFAAAEKTISFSGVKDEFMDKVKSYADITYRNAFFRNSYDSYEAWKACITFKRYQKLFYGLDLMPEGAKERIDGMSAELDSTWSRPEVEEEFRNAQADELLGTGGGVGGMVDNILREKPELMSKDDHQRLYEIRPDLVPGSYDDYVQEFNTVKHPFALKL